jgi:7-carboxy-7-deazaguanine synthase
MKVSEIFYSIQGEGILAGVPSVFMRLSGCNLRCVWCDTPYTSWSPEGHDMPLDEILKQVRGYGASHVVLTGGEPMIFPECVELTRRLKQASLLHLTVETAGTVYQPVACDLMSISPKLANSTPREREGGRWAAQHDRLRYQPDVLRKLTSEYTYQLKFVVTEPEDMPEIEAIVKEIGADPRQVVLMPEGIGAEALRHRARWLAELCKQHGFRYSPRLHIDIWGNQRGV